MWVIDFFKKLKDNAKRKADAYKRAKTFNPAYLPKYMFLKNADKIAQDNVFFKNLRLEYQILFDNLDFIPSNFDEANNFLKSYFNLNELKDFTVLLPFPVVINGQKVNSIDIKKNYPYNCLFPSVWSQMNAGEKLKATMMLYNLVLNEKIVKISQKPELRFISNDDKLESNGYYSSAQNVLQISLYTILEDSSNGLEILKTIAHELTHAEQAHELKKIFEFLKNNNFDFSLLSNYEKKLFFHQTNYVFENIDNVLEIYKKFSKLPVKNILSKQDLKLWLSLEENDNYCWSYLKYLCYACNQNEISAQNAGQKFFDKVTREYLKDCDLPQYSRTSADVAIAFLRYKGYDISYSQKEDFAQISYYCQINPCVETTLEIVSYLLEIYKTHKIDRPFKENYQEIEDEHFKKIQNNLIAYYGKENEKNN